MVRRTHFAAAAVLVFLAAPLSAQSEPQSAPLQQETAQEASDFVVGLNALNNQVIDALDQQPTRRVLVLPIADSDGNFTRVSTYLREQLITALIATRKYQIVEDRELADAVRSAGTSPLEISSTDLFRRFAPKLANVSVIVGAMTDLQVKFAVQMRVINGKTGEFAGGAVVYIKVGEEIASLLDTDRAQYRPDMLAHTQTQKQPDAMPQDSRPATPMTQKQQPATTNAKTAETAAKPQMTADDQTGLPPDVAGQTDLAIYRMGRERFERRRFSEAAGYFSAVVAKFPDSPLADNAYYWVGECYYNQKSWQKALETFQRVLDEYPYGNKVPAATLKRGFALEELGRTDEAIAAMDQVIKRFADSPEAAIAKQKMQVLRAEKQR